MGSGKHCLKNCVMRCRSCEAVSSHITLLSYYITIYIMDLAARLRLLAVWPHSVTVPSHACLVLVSPPRARSALPPLRPALRPASRCPMRHRSCSTRLGATHCGRCCSSWRSATAKRRRLPSAKPAHSMCPCPPALVRVGVRVEVRVGVRVRVRVRVSRTAG